MTTLDHAGTAGPDTLAASGRFPAGPPAPFAPPEQGPARARGRLAGVDAARGLAVIGMIVVHVAAGRLIASGLVGAVLGYGGSWLAVDVLGRQQALLDAVAAFVAGAVLAATGWRSLVGRGPLEALLHAASARAGGSR